MNNITSRQVCAAAKVLGWFETIALVLNLLLGIIGVYADAEHLS